MTEEEKLNKIQELRKKLADGRANSSSTQDTDGYATTLDREDGGGVQAVLGQGEGLTGNVRQLGGNTRKSASYNRSFRGIALRERSSSIGLSDDNSSADSDTPETRISGRLVASDAVPLRREDVQETLQGASQSQKARGTKTRASSKAGKSPDTRQQGALPPENRSTKKGFKLPGLSEIPGIGKGKTLSDREAKELRENFRTSIEDDFSYIDQWLRAKSGDRTLEIWSNADDEELDKVTDVFLRGAQRSPILATVVRETVNTHDYIVVGMVFLPRLQQTVATLRAARANNPRPARWQRTAARRMNPAMNGASHE